MKKIVLLLTALLFVSNIALAQLKLHVHKMDGEIVEFVASEVNYIDFDDSNIIPDQIPPYFVGAFKPKTEGSNYSMRRIVE